jgi:hypothetical protein
VVGTSSSADYLLTDTGELDPAYEIELTRMQAGPGQGSQEKSSKWPGVCGYADPLAWACASAW